MTGDARRAYGLAVGSFLPMGLGVGALGLMILEGLAGVGGKPGALLYLLAFAAGVGPSVSMQVAAHRLASPAPRAARVIALGGLVLNGILVIGVLVNLVPRFF